MTEFFLLLIHILVRFMAFLGKRFLNEKTTFADNFVANQERRVFKQPIAYEYLRTSTSRRNSFSKQLCDKICRYVNILT